MVNGRVSNATQITVSFPCTELLHPLGVVLAYYIRMPKFGPKKINVVICFPSFGVSCFSLKNCSYICITFLVGHALGREKESITRSSGLDDNIFNKKTHNCNF